MGCLPLNTVVKILIYIAIIFAVFILCRITYKIIKWLAAKNIRDKILAEFPFCDIRVENLGALCSYYAEKGGLLVGFEDGGA